jgi:hypothetical protein
VNVPVDATVVRVACVEATPVPLPTPVAVKIKPSVLDNAPMVVQEVDPRLVII